jgi:hypothetical protein
MVMRYLSINWRTVGNVSVLGRMMRVSKSPAVPGIKNSSEVYNYHLLLLYLYPEKNCQGLIFKTSKVYRPNLVF